MPEPLPRATPAYLSDRSAPASDPPRPIETLYREHFQFIWCGLRRLGVRDGSIEDAAQDVFVIAHRKLHEFEGRSSHRTWLFAIALRVAAEYRRRDRHVAPSDLPASPEAFHDDSVESRRRARLLDVLLGELSDEQREVFVMAELQELSAPEIAELLGVKLNTVYSRLRLARRRFERAIAHHRRELGRGER